jgi:hypothetical protein
VQVEFIPDTRVSLVGGSSAPYIAKIRALPGEPPLPVFAAMPELPLTSPAVSTEILLVGRGHDRGAEWPDAIDHSGWFLQTPPVLGERVMRWGTNRVSRVSPGGAHAQFGRIHASHSCFDQGGDAPTAHEAAATNGDSGGSLWSKRADGEWLLAGIIQTSSCSTGDHCACTEGPAGTGSNDLSHPDYRIPILTNVDPSDQDGVLIDNCANVPNRDQLDSDGDGYGNVCDGDIDQNGAVGTSDFYACFGSPSCIGNQLPFAGGHPATSECRECDLNGDGAVGIADFSLLGQSIGSSVGPSDLACATSPPTEGSCP